MPRLVTGLGVWLLLGTCLGCGTAETDPSQAAAPAEADVDLSEFRSKFVGRWKNASDYMLTFTVDGLVIIDIALFNDGPFQQPYRVPSPSTVEFNNGKAELHDDKLGATVELPSGGRISDLYQRVEDDTDGTDSDDEDSGQ